MSKILLTADWHLDANPRDAYRFGAVERIGKLLREHEVEHLFILGDLTEHPDHHSAAFTNRVVDLLAGLAKLCKVTIIRGNHDGSDPSTPFFRFINAIPNLRFLTQPEVQGGIALIPHGCWPERLPECDMVFTHHTFAGAKAEHGKMLGGLRLPVGNTPIYSGDIHVPQTRGLLTYIGPPTLINFGDDFQPRVLLMQPGQPPKSIPMHGPTKRRIEVIAHPDGSLDWRDAHVGVGDIVKVRVIFTGAIPSLAHLRADIADHVSKSRLDLTLYSVVPVIEDRTSAIPTKPVSRSDTDLVRQYAKTRSFDRPTVEAGLAIVEERT